MSEKPTIRGDLGILGIADQELLAATRPGTDWDEKTLLLHQLFRSKRKELMRRYHPDVAGEAGLERCQEINAACDRLLKGVRVGPPPQAAPAPMPWWVGATASAETGTSTDGTGTFYTWKVTWSF